MIAAVTIDAGNKTHGKKKWDNTSIPAKIAAPKATYLIAVFIVFTPKG
jgi:hypothetical protein